MVRKLTCKPGDIQFKATQTKLQCIVELNSGIWDLNVIDTFSDRSKLELYCRDRLGNKYNVTVKHMESDIWVTPRQKRGLMA